MNEFFTKLHVSLKAELEFFSSTLKKQGKEYLGRINKIGWNEENNCLEARVKGQKQPFYTVSLYLYQDFERKNLIEKIVCNCPFSASKFECKHGAAFLSKLSLLIQDDRTTALIPTYEYVVAKREGRKTVPEWEKTLAELNFILNKKLVEGDAEVGSSKLTWRIVANEQGIRSIAPFEKRIAVNGRETGGKKLELEALQQRFDEWQDVRDRKVVKSMKTAKEPYSYSDYQLTLDLQLTLEGLVGHPYLYFEDDLITPVRILHKKAGFSIDGDSSKGYYLRVYFEALSPMQQNCIHQFNDGNFYHLDFEKNKITLFDISHNFLELFDEMRSKKVDVPHEVTYHFLNSLEKISRFVPVRLPQEMLGDKVVADTTLNLVLDISEHKVLDLKIKIKPFSSIKGEVVHSFFPGDGVKRIFGRVAGERVYTERDLEGEFLIAEELIKETGLYEFEVSPFHYSVDEIDPALEILEKLYKRKEEKTIDVEWADSSRQLAIKGSVTSSLLKVQVEKEADWFGISGGITIEGEEMPLSTLMSNIRKGRKYVPLSKGGYLKIEKHLRDRLEVLALTSADKNNKIETGLAAIPIIKEMLREAGEAKVSREWTNLTSRVDELATLKPELPAELTAALRDYQVDGFRWMVAMSEWGPGVCLADDMGLGKTVQALGLLLYRASKKKGPTIVIAPTSLGFNWVEECKKFAPTLNPILYRDVDRDQNLEQLSSNDILITSYYISVIDIEKLSGIRWGTMVLDEAQAIKNSRTKRSQALREIKADWTLALTGTPMENNLGELWSLYRVVSPSLFGTWEHFRRSFAEPIQKFRNDERRDALRRIIKPFLLRRTKSEVLKELPMKTETDIYVEFSPLELQLYNALRVEALTDIKGGGNVDGSNVGQRRFKVLAWLTKLRQACCHPQLVDPSSHFLSSKMTSFIKTVRELVLENHRVLVFSQFTSYLALVRAAVEEEGLTYQYLDGSIAAKEREKRVKAFQAGEGELFLISLKAGGSGLNLTGADYVIHLDPWWNPAVEDQASDRAHRIGQTRPVTIYKFIAKGTIEEKILSLHKDKRELIGAVLAGSDQAAKMPIEELIKLFETPLE